MVTKKHYGIGIGILTIFVLALLLVPIKQPRVISSGIDSYVTHRPLFAGRTLAQKVTLSGKLVGVGAIIVPFGQHVTPSDIQVSVTPENDSEPVATAVISKNAIQDDAFASTAFTSPILKRSETVLLEFTAPGADKDNMLGLRFDPEPEDMSLQRIEQGISTTGVYAILLIEQVPLWQYIVTVITLNAGDFSVIGVALLTAFLVSLLALEIGWSNKPERTKHALRIAFALILASLALNVRLWLLPQLGGVSGGDPYNYLYITDNLVHGDNPFAGNKRLPGYPLLLAPAYLSTSINDVTFMRLVQMVSACATVFLLPFLLRTLRLPWLIAFPAAAVLAFQKDFFWTSQRLEPYSVYAFLLTLSLLLFFHLHKKWVRYLFGFVLGYAAMTRQEGFVLAAILGVAALFQYRAFLPAGVSFSSLPKNEAWLHLIKGYLQAFIPALILVMPFFIHNTLTFGNPIFTPYFEGERLQIVNSWAAFKDSAGATWGVIDSMWRPSWDQLDRVSLDHPLFLGTIAVSLALFAFSRIAHKKLPGPIHAIVLIGVGAYVAIASSWIYLDDKGLLTELATVIPSALLFAGIVPLIIMGRLPATLAFIVLSSQVLIATWFHPFAKHYQQSYPLLSALLITATLAPLAHTFFSQKRAGRVAAVVFVTSILLPFGILALSLFQSINQYVDKHNAATALDSVVYRAIQQARKYPGPHGVDQAYLPARLYFGGSGYYFPDEENPTSQQEQEWLEQFGIKTLVVTTNNKVFDEVDPAWHMVSHHKSEGKDERLYESFVYIIP